MHCFNVWRNDDDNGKKIDSFSFIVSDFFMQVFLLLHKKHFSQKMKNLTPPPWLASKKKFTHLSFILHFSSTICIDLNLSTDWELFLADYFDCFEKFFVPLPLHWPLGLFWNSYFLKIWALPGLSRPFPACFGIYFSFFFVHC